MRYFLSRLLVLSWTRDQKNMARKRSPRFGYALISASSVALAGCELIGDIFQAGVWVGVIIVALAIGLVVWLFNRFRT